MNQEQRKTERIRAGIATVGAAERQAIKAAAMAIDRIRDGKSRALVLSRLMDIYAARGRDTRKAASDAATDAGRRKLVGARVPAAFAARCAACAAAEGVSLYRWTYNALKAACNVTNGDICGKLPGNE